MSSEQEEQARGRILNQYIEAKKRLVILESEAKKAGELFQRLGNSFSQKSLNSPQLTNDINVLPTSEHLTALIADIRETARLKSEAKQQLEQLGVDFKA